MSNLYACQQNENGKKGVEEELLIVDYVWPLWDFHNFDMHKTREAFKPESPLH